MSDHPSLIAAFDRLGIPVDARSLILAHHSEPHRHYHTLRHIDLMLGELPSNHPFAHEMIAATLFHDIVYNPARTDNEDRSLAVFQTAARTLTPMAPLDLSLVTAMILATKSHDFQDESTAEGEAINILLKADLSILWHPDPEVYAWYAAGVRKEYAFVSDKQFCEARAKILMGLRDDLLQSEHLTAGEATALSRNVAWELN